MPDLTESDRADEVARASIDGLVAVTNFVPSVEDGYPLQKKLRIWRGKLLCAAAYYC